MLLALLASSSLKVLEKRLCQALSLIPMLRLELISGPAARSLFIVLSKAPVIGLQLSSCARAGAAFEPARTQLVYCLSKAPAAGLEVSFCARAGAACKLFEPARACSFDATELPVLSAGAQTLGSARTQLLSRGRRGAPADGALKQRLHALHRSNAALSALLRKLDAQLELAYAALPDAEPLGARAPSCCRAMRSMMPAAQAAPACVCAAQEAKRRGRRCSGAGRAAWSLRVRRSSSPKC